VQKRRAGERARARVRERAEDERAGQQGERGRGRADGDTTHRIDGLPATVGAHAKRGADSLDERARAPRDERRLPVVERFDERPRQGRHEDRLAARDEMVVGVACAR